MVSSSFDSLLSLNDSTQLKILVTSPTYPPFNSGLGNAAQQQAAALVDNGFSVVVATAGPKRCHRRDDLSGALVEEFDVQGADSLLNPMRGNIAAYEQFLVESDFDFVLMNAWQTWSTDLILRRLKSVAGRKILYSHCLSTNVFFPHQALRSMIRYLLWRPYWWRLSQKLGQLDGLIFLAEEGCDSRFDDLRLARSLGIPFHIVPNALSPAALDVLRRATVGRESREQLIAIGSYDWLKGHDFVLNAYAFSCAKNRIPLKIFGQMYSPFTNKLRQQAAKLGIKDDYISFHEGVSGAALLEECSRSIMLLSGSQTECQPLVLLDSMAAGTPFVARSTGCITSLSGGVGVRTEVEAARMIDQLLSDNVEWACLSDAGKKEVAEKNLPDSVGRKLISALLGAAL